MALKKWLDKIALLDLFDGLSVTGRHLFKKKVTVEYPEQKRLPSDRFRGMFRLDEERCIKCTLCAIECPINIIYIDWHNEKDEQNKSVKVLDRCLRHVDAVRLDLRSHCCRLRHLISSS